MKFILILVLLHHAAAIDDDSCTFSEDGKCDDGTWYECRIRGSCPDDGTEHNCLAGSDKIDCAERCTACSECRAIGGTWNDGQVTLAVNRAWRTNNTAETITGSTITGAWGLGSAATFTGTYNEVAGTGTGTGTLVLPDYYLKDLPFAKFNVLDSQNPADGFWANTKDPGGGAVQFNVLEATDPQRFMVSRDGQDKATDNARIGLCRTASGHMRKTLAVMLYSSTFLMVCQPQGQTGDQGEWAPSQNKNTTQIHTDFVHVTLDPVYKDQLLPSGCGDRI
jgi:hypothetical protein